MKDEGAKEKEPDKKEGTGKDASSRAAEAKADRIMSDLEKASPAASKDYADKIRSKLASAEDARRDLEEEAKKEREQDADIVEDVARRLREKRSEDLSRLKEKSTTGEGGSRSPPMGNATSAPQPEKDYTPARTSWGVFDRPKNISEAYGGGNKMGAGVNLSPEEEARRDAETEETLARLKRYREKRGDGNRLEKKEAKRIASALDLARRAMMRGVYAAAVDALEGVVEFCSTGTEVGGTVFLELGMAYEAAGMKAEARTVYSQLAQTGRSKVRGGVFGFADDGHRY